MQHLVDGISVVLIGKQSSVIPTIAEMLQQFGYNIVGVINNGSADPAKVLGLEPKVVVVDASDTQRDFALYLASTLYRQHGIPSLITTSIHDEATLKAVLDNNGVSYWAWPADGHALHTALQTCLKHNAVEPTLGEKEQLYRTTFEDSPIGIAIVRLKDFQLVKTNKSYRKLLGYSEEELKGLGIADFTHPDDLEENLRLQRLLGSGAINYYSMDKRFIRKDQTIAHGHLVASIIREEKGKPSYFLGQVIDISERIAIEAQRQELENQLRQSQKMEALGTLAGGIAHDFNNILGAIVGYTELAMGEIAVGAPVMDDLQQVLAAADRAKTLVRQIISFSQNTKPNLRPLDIQQVIEYTVIMLQQTMPKSISITNRIVDRIPLIVGDTDHLRQILINLSNNAVEAMPDGGTLSLVTSLVDVPGALCHACGKPFSGKYVKLTVKDTGRGMDTVTMGHIFEPFFTTKEVGQGSGLGLAAVFGLLNSFGGHIVCTSSAGHGSTFELFFPTIIETGDEGPTNAV